MNSAYNHIPLNEKSRRLTQFVLGNQQNSLDQLLKSKKFRSLMLNKKQITYLNDVIIESQTIAENFSVFEKHHHKSQTNILNTAPDKSHFFLFLIVPKLVLT